MKTLYLSIIMLISFSMVTAIPFVKAEVQPKCPQEIVEPFQDNLSSYTKKAISLAENDSQFIRNEDNSTFKFYAIYVQWLYDAKKCNNFSWYSVNVVFQRQDNTLPRYIIAIEDPALSLVETTASIGTGSPHFKSDDVQDTPQAFRYIGMSGYIGYGIPKVDASPLKQVKAGLWGNDVQCRNDLTLMSFPQDRSVACVKPSSLPRLESLGWMSYNHTISYDKYPWCPRASVSLQDSKIVVTCSHAVNQSLGIFSLPAPTYHLYHCAGGFGCSFEYAYSAQNNTHLLSIPQKQQVIDRIARLPEFDSGSGWRLDHFITYPRADRWFADIQMFLPVQQNQTQACGRYTQIGVDLQNLAIMYEINANETSYVECEDK